MEGISKETLIEIIKHTPFLSIEELIYECTELNPWQPIETAPKNRQLLLRNEFYRCTGQWGDIINEWVDDGNRIMMPTHWQELPEDPK